MSKQRLTFGGVWEDPVASALDHRVLGGLLATVSLSLFVVAVGHTEAGPPHHHPRSQGHVPHGLAGARPRGVLASVVVLLDSVLLHVLALLHQGQPARRVVKLSCV